MNDSELSTIEVTVTFDRPSDGGLHDVVIASPGSNATEIWRRWGGGDRILVVANPSEGATESAVYDTRWFSPSGEIELCGSGAIAAAQVIFRRTPLGSDQVYLRGIHHNITAARVGQDLRIRLPNFDTTTCTLPSFVQEGLGIVEWVTCVTNHDLRTVVVQLPAGTDLLSVQPDFRQFGATRHVGLEALIVTVKGDDPGTFDYRYFTPWHGLDESPVAVSANGLLGPFWQCRWNQASLIGRQLSDLRPSFILQVEAEGTWVDAKSSLNHEFRESV